MIRRIANALLRKVMPPIDIVTPMEEPSAAPVKPAAQGPIAARIQSDRIVLFMKGMPDRPQCGFSASVVGTLNGLGVPFTAVDVLRDPAIREGVKVFSKWPTIPQLYVDGVFVGGADIVAEMAADGSLASLLGVAEAPAVNQTSPVQVADWLAAGKVRVLDVRTDAERAIASVEGVQPLRPEDFAALEQLPHDTRLAFLCHHGIRSQSAAEAFRQIGFMDLHNVVGGIEAWSVSVDPTVPRYG